MVARFASVLGKQARGTVLLEAPQQTKYLTPLEADQRTGVSNTQTTRLNPKQHVKTAELRLAHRQHRHHGAPPGTPEPGKVSPLYCRGVSSLYCAYMGCPRNTRSGKVAASWMSLIKIPDELVAIRLSEGATAEILAKRSRFTSTLSGPFSWMNAQPSTARVFSGAKRSRLREAPPARPMCSRAR